MIPLSIVLRKYGVIIKATFCAVFVVFCVTNVYQSLVLSERSMSSHDYLRGARAVRAQQRQRSSNNITLGMPSSELKHEFILDSARLNGLRPASVIDYPKYSVRIGDQVRDVPLWQRRLLAEKGLNKSDNSGIDDGGHFYFLTELLQVRIYAGDKSHWSVRELKQWLHFMLLAGVEHFYVCDHFVESAERLDVALKRYIDAGLVTYLAWNTASRNSLMAQIKCYQRLVKRYHRRHKWQIAIDMDEYPFAPNDTTENFLSRYLERLPESVTEVSLPNYLMLGEGDRSRSRTLVDRIVRITRTPANALVKPVYRPDRIQGVNVHRNHLDSGIRIDAAPYRLKMLHYWGASRFGSAADRRLTLSKTAEMFAMRDFWSEQIENSLIVFGENDAFSNVTGP